MLLEGYDPEAMDAAEIYPEAWGDGDLDREYISTHYSELAAFFRAAARAGDAMLLYLR